MIQSLLTHSLFLSEPLGPFQMSAQEKAPPLAGGAVRQSNQGNDSDCSVAKAFDN
jgi:hypothetical protein